MKKLFGLFLAVLVMIPGVVYSFSVAPFPYEGKLNPNEIVKWEVTKQSDVETNSWTYMVMVKDKNNHAVILIQLPYDRVVGWAYYDKGLRIYNMSVLEEKYIEIPHRQNTVDVIESFMEFKGM